MPHSRVRSNRYKRRNNTRKYGRGRRSGLQSRRDAALNELVIAGSLVGASAITQGSELEQNAANNGQEDLMFVGGSTRKHRCDNDIAEHILCFLELLNTIKIYHWSTLSYPTHKATDELHSKMSELVDSFIELYIGHCSRSNGKKSNGVPIFGFKSEKETCIEFCECKSLDAFCKVLDDNIVHLESLTNKLKDYTDLVNIRDEMVGALAQALYLLRLK